MMAKISLLGLILTTVVGLGFAADMSPTSSPALPMATEKSDPAKVKIMKILITVNGKPIRATLADNATARDFVDLLPLTITLEDYSRTEKIYYLPKKLSTEGAPSGTDPAIGDITYYAPWGNLAIFYKDFGYSSGLIKLGHIESGGESLNVSGTLKAKIELIRD
jgi:hypothetical protein